MQSAAGQASHAVKHRLFTPAESCPLWSFTKCVRPFMCMTPHVCRRAAASTALGHVACSLASDPTIYITTPGSTNAALPKELHAVCTALASLLAALRVLRPETAGPVQTISMAYPAEWSVPQRFDKAMSAMEGLDPYPQSKIDSSESYEALQGVLPALVRLAAEVARVGGSKAEAPLHAMWALIRSMLSGGLGGVSLAQGSSTDSAPGAAAAAAATAAADLLPAMLGMGAINDTTYMGAFQEVACLAGVSWQAADGTSDAPAMHAALPNGQARGGALHAAGRLMQSALQCGLQSAEGQMQAFVHSMCSALAAEAPGASNSGVLLKGSESTASAAASKPVIPPPCTLHASAARCGAAAGLTALLVALPHMDVVQGPGLVQGKYRLCI